MGTSNFDKFLLLLWKNWILQWNHKIQFIIELLLPVGFSMLLVLVRTIVAPEFSDVIIYNQSLPIDNLDLLKSIMGRASLYKSINLQTIESRIHLGRGLNIPLKYHLAYSPNTNPIFENIVKEAAGSLDITYSGYANSRALEDGLVNNNYLAGVEFDDSMANITAYPEQLNYRLRFPSELRTSLTGIITTWQTNVRFKPMDTLGPRNEEDIDGGIPSGYLREGFLPVQNAISRAFITQSPKNNLKGPLPKVFLQRYPYPAYNHDPLFAGLAGIMAMITLLSYIYPCTYTVKYITAEKEKQLKEVMKIMGLPNWLHWTAWFVKAFLMMGFSSILITIVLTVKWNNDVAVLTYSSFTAVLFFLLVYVTTSITLCFMLATFFSKASTATAVTGLIWFILYIPYSFFQLNYQYLSFATKLGSSLISNTAMGLGMRLIIVSESGGVGLQWDNMFSRANIDDPLTVGQVVCMMLLSCVIYMTICLYMEQIYPGEFGVPKKWYFPFTKAFWVGEPAYIGIEDSSQIKRDNPDVFEVEPIGKKIGIQVNNLTKVFGERKAVNNVSLNMYEDEITVLLGHNGAGKTTMISMLTGMFPPSSGTAIINGYDIRTNIDGARMSLGICPQYNILFDDLTVRHHLIFYGRLKGLKGVELEAEVIKYIKKIELENKANVVSSKLSGGMKRKLSVCAAFCGGTKVVLCDEPSSGMDPAARRQLWDLLQSEKIGRTILLTTHFMDEADVLGDRLAIMSAGDLKCIGTSFFLKKKFGSGYHLICVKKTNCNSSHVTKLLSKYIPGIQPEAEIGAELSYQLPDEYSSKFENMFQDLEKNSDKLNLNGYGVSITSLEEVFMKVGSETPAGSRDSLLDSVMSGSGFGSEDGESMSSDMFSDNQRLLKGSKLMLNQWHSMILKKYTHTIHNKFLFAIQNLMPILFIAMTIIVVSTSNFAVLKPIKLGLEQYPDTVTVLEISSNVKDGSLEAQIGKNYEEVVNKYGPVHQFAQTGNLSFIDYILQLGKIMQLRINARYIAAATVNEGNITAWLNNKPLHSAPVTINLIHNAMARIALGPNAFINVTNAPLPYTPDTLLKYLNTGQNLGTQMSMNLCFCMCFVSALYVMFLIKEKQSRAKLLQFVGGVRIFTFWLSHFVCDLFTYTITALIVMITFACFQEEGFSTFDELGRHLVVIMIFGCSALPLTYIVAGNFLEPSTGFARLSVINIFFGDALFVVLIVMRYEEFDTQHIADILEKFFLAFPHFSLAQGMNKLFMNGQIKKFCEPLLVLPDKYLCAAAPQCCTLVPYFAWDSPGVLREIVYLIVTTFVFFLILIINEYRVIDNIWLQIKQKTTRPPPPPEDGYFDEDVEQEKERVRNMSSSEISIQNLVLDRLTKFYGRFVAVNQISVGIRHTECFGLLGVNGAGKTTTFKMLTGDVRISSGDAFVKGLSLKSDMDQVYQNIGYCPQFDALFDDFTGREMLKMFALLLGIPNNKIHQVSTDLARSFGFMQHFDKQVRAYSGGNKRKLSTAIAVLGSPSVIYLDEPTTGMDPGARRQLWNMVCRIRDAGKAIVLTSHSMEECEALCTRLAIMVNGEFKCIGSTQHLKNKFTKGMILKLKMKKDTEMTRSFIDNNQEQEKTMPIELMEEDIKKVMQFINEEFPEAFLQEQFQGILTFYIPITSILWSKIFGLMERNKASLNIEDYSISQTTLEEVFLQFAKYQREDPREIKHHDGFFKKCVKRIRAKT